MQITVINNRAAGGASVPCVDSTQCDPGQSRVMPGRTARDVALQMYHADGNDVLVLCQIEGEDRAPVVCDMKNPADPAGGTFNVAGCGFDLNTEAGAAANVNPPMYMGAFDDEDCTIPSVDGTLDTAAVGTIDEGAGTNLLEVTPDAAGEFSVTLTVTGAGTIYLKAWPMGTEYIIDSSETDEITFTP